MRIGALQVKTSGSVSANLSRITEAVRMAERQNVRLLVLPECALCGYPPVEVAAVADIDFNKVDAGISALKDLAKEYSIYIAVGTIRKEDRYYNSTVLLGPDGNTAGIYDKRALWGWDMENFAPGTSDGIFDIDGVRIAFRICFEVRFPEYFREAFRAQAQLCVVSFCDVSLKPLPERYALLKAHLMTRACENVMPVISVNSISNFQAAPTAAFNAEGMVLCEAPKEVEYLLIYDYKKGKALEFGTKGRRLYAKKLSGFCCGQAGESD